MPFTAEMRSKIEQIRDYLYGGGYPNPLANAEQLSFLFFFNMMEGLDRDNKLLDSKYTSIFEGKSTAKNPNNTDKSGKIDKEKFRWSAWAVGMDWRGTSELCKRRSISVLCRDYIRNC